MAEHTIDGQQKYLNYKEQFGRLSRALANEFYLEAIFIEYAILEDRTQSLLEHGGHWSACKKKCGKKPGIHAKLNFIQNLAANPSHPLNKYFADDLTDKLLAWKDKRNPLIHALLKQKLGPDDLKNVATEGSELVKELRNRVTKHNRAVDRKNARKAAKG